MLHIRLSYTCQRCRGTGIASDPEAFGYADLYERARKANRDNGPGASIHAYNRLCEQRLAEFGLGEYPPEEAPCQPCAETGELTGLFSEEDLVAAVEARDRALLDAGTHRIAT